MKRRCLEAGGRAILLPTPSLGKDSFHDPRDTLGVEAHQRGVSTRQIHREALTEIRDWLALSNEDPARFDSLLGVPASS